MFNEIKAFADSYLMKVPNTPMHFVVLLSHFRSRFAMSLLIGSVLVSSVSFVHCRSGF